MQTASLHATQALFKRFSTTTLQRHIASHIHTPRPHVLSHNMNKHFFFLFSVSLRIQYHSQIHKDSVLFLLLQNSFSHTHLLAGSVTPFKRHFIFIFIYFYEDVKVLKVWDCWRQSRHPSARAHCAEHCQNVWKHPSKI